MDLELSGKRALVTGASRGIGYAIALELAKEGCAVAINGRNYPTLEEAAEKIRAEVKKELGVGGQVVPISGDVSDPSAVRSVIERSITALRGLDLLVTNTGGPPSGDFEKITDEEWERAVDALLMAHVRLIRYALPYLRKSPAPSVLTITSYSVKQPIPKLVLSNSVRAATAALTKTLALELGHDHIRFNSILPGWTATGRVQELMEARAKEKGTTASDEIKKQSREIPLGRLAQPSEIAKAAVFLLSPAASYITGALLNVDGGIYRGFC